MNRKRENLTISQTATIIGVSESYISLIENDKRIPNPGVAKKLGKLFHFDWHLFYEDNEYSDNKGVG
jgi:transcriptional regulator with XRE-family HTH domain